MVIDKIGNINKIVDPKGSKKVSKNGDTKKSDSLVISKEGKQAAEIARYTKIVNATPDIRAEKVREIKEQIKNGVYDKFNDNRALEMVAEKIADALLRK